MNKLYSLVVLAFFTASYSEVSNAAVPQGEDSDLKTFEQCIPSLQVEAEKQGLSQKTITQVIPNLKFVPRVVELDRRQPEFTQTFADYYNKRVTDWRVQEGRRLFKEHQKFLLELTNKYGVPPQYLLAFWGMETNFGAYKGKMLVLDSLATLACDDRRKTYFTQELMQALKLKEKYQFTAEHMVGSWAGAMGHTQFMPSAYLHYAVDGDGDGKADLWSSTDDALSSAAHFLQQLGWKRNERWGREVTLPKNFDYQYLGKSQAKSLKEWAESGIKLANGRPLNTPDMTAALYLPAGHKGPAFLAYHNFDVMMRWNRSVFYGISVGQLADRISGAGHLVIAPPEQEQLSREQIKLIQKKLNQRGYDVGKPDGILGTKSSNGLRAFQRSQGLIADGFPQQETLTALKL